METFLNFSGLQFSLFMKLATPKSHFKMMICILHPLHFHYHIYPFYVSAKVSVLDFCALTPAVKDSFIIITIQYKMQKKTVFAWSECYCTWTELGGTAQLPDGYISVFGEHISRQFRIPIHPENIRKSEIFVSFQVV